MRNRACALRASFVAPFIQLRIKFKLISVFAFCSAKKFHVIISQFFMDAEFDIECICEDLRRDGIAIVRNVLSREECAAFAVDFVARNRFVLENMSPVKPGQHKDLLCNDQALWRLRQDPRLKRLWQECYARLNGSAMPEVLCSVDGVCIKSDLEAPYYDAKTSKDWAHLDQTRGCAYDCIQGQLIFSESSACFRASPRSHKIWSRVLEIMHVAPEDASHWCLISKRASPEQLREIQALLESVGGEWQVPIAAPPGSLILWLSSVIHSAQASRAPSKARKRNADAALNLRELKLWRCVAYISFVQLQFLSWQQREARWHAIEHNLSLNHWCHKVWRSSWRPQSNARLHAYLERPETWPQFDAAAVRAIIAHERTTLLG